MCVCMCVLFFFKHDMYMYIIIQVQFTLTIVWEPTESPSGWSSLDVSASYRPSSTSVNAVFSRCQRAPETVATTHPPTPTKCHVVVDALRVWCLVFSLFGS